MILKTIPASIRLEPSKLSLDQFDQLRLGLYSTPTHNLISLGAQFMGLLVHSDSVDAKGEKNPFDIIG